MMEVVSYHVSNSIGRRPAVILSEGPKRLRVAYIDSRVVIRYVPVSERSMMTAMDYPVAKAIRTMRSAWKTLNKKPIKEHGHIVDWKETRPPAELKVA